MTINLKRQEFFSEYKEEKAQLSRQEYFRCRLEGVVILIALTVFFYRSLWAIPFLMPVYLIHQRKKRKLLLLRKRKETTVQFKDAILAVAASQKSGYSVENSFKRAYEDMLHLYGKDSRICKELYGIVVGLSNNLILEKLLYDFGKRSKIKDIMEFADVFAAAKRNGGNLTEVIERSASIIEDKVETEKEIQVMISARRMEQKIMNIVPFGILFYISFTSKGFFDVLYHNPPGILIMTLCLVVYMAAVLLSEKIVNIEV